MVWLSGPKAGFPKGKYVWTNSGVDKSKYRSVEIKELNSLELILLGPIVPERRLLEDRIRALERLLCFRMSSRNMHLQSLCLR